MNDGEIGQVLAVAGGATRAKTWKAAVIAGPREVGWLETPRTEPGPGEVLVSVEGCGLCASSIPVWEGRPWFQYPLPPGAPGHEGWGTIAECGPGVPSSRVGTRVCFLSDAALAEGVVVPLEHTVEIPSAFGNLPFPGEPLACATLAFRRARVAPDERVAVVGVGFLGAVVIQLAAAAGARVVALSRRTFSLKVARRCGATEVLPLKAAFTGDAALEGDTASAGGAVSADADPVATAMSLTGGASFDVVFEAAGFQSTLDCATALTRESGRLVIAGFHQDGPRQVDLGAWNWRALEVINAHQRRPEEYIAGMRAAIEAMEEGRLNPFPLFTHTFRFDRLAEALDTLIARPDGFVKALVLP